MNECIRRRIQLLREKHINRRKQHVLESRKHLHYLHELQSKYVLVPVDKAANLIIVVCKKYYLEVVLNELRTTNTYKHVDRECMDVVIEHLKFMTNYKLYVDLRYLPSFYWLPKLHKQPYGTRFIAASNKCSIQSLCPSYLLFLFYYEYKYMKNLIKNNIILAKKFNNTMRYIDNLLTLNNNQFDAAFKDIYRQELQLKKTTVCLSSVIFITIDNGRYSTAVFDKRDSFTFNIVNFPHLSSNIPSKPAYGVYISQLVRICRICSNFV